MYSKVSYTPALLCVCKKLWYKNESIICFVPKEASVWPTASTVTWYVTLYFLDKRLWLWFALYKDMNSKMVTTLSFGCLLCSNAIGILGYIEQNIVKKMFTQNKFRRSNVLGFQNIVLAVRSTQRYWKICINK